MCLHTAQFPTCPTATFTVVCILHTFLPLTSSLSTLLLKQKYIKVLLQMLQLLFLPPFSVPCTGNAPNSSLMDHTSWCIQWSVVRLYLPCSTHCRTYAPREEVQSSAFLSGAVLSLLSIGINACTELKAEVGPACVIAHTYSYF